MINARKSIATTRATVNFQKREYLIIIRSMPARGRSCATVRLDTAATIVVKNSSVEPLRNHGYRRF